MHQQEDGQPDYSAWPSVDLAYEFVAPSYDWIQRRFESVERRIQTFLAFTATLTLGVPALTFAIEKSVHFGSIWFMAAMASAILTLTLGIVAVVISNTSGIWYLSPDSLQDLLHYNEQEFKNNAIYWAGQHFNANVSLINKMEWILTSMLCLFSVEVILLLIWVIISLA